MSRKQLLWLGSAVWGAGFIVSGAFAFAMNQPLTIYRDVSPRPIERVELTQAVVRTPSPIIPTFTFPEIVITVPRAQLAPRVAAAPPPPRDLQQMNCADWRPLEQGGNAVRECQ